MRIALSTIALSATIACAPGGTFSGKLTDGLHGTPLVKQRVIAKATNAQDPTCAAFEAITGDDGTFFLENTCKETEYKLKLTDKTLVMQDAPIVHGGTPAEGVAEVTVWRAPSGEGMSILENDRLRALSTFSDVGTEGILGSEVRVRYPTKKPLRVPPMPPGSHLVINGADLVQSHEIIPLVQDKGIRKFQGEVTIEDHVYIGVRFLSDTKFEAVSTTVDASKVLSVQTGDRSFKYIAVDAVPAGRYAVLGQKGRVTIIDFGTKAK